MNSKAKAGAVVGALALGATLAPVSLNWNALSSGTLTGSTGIVRLNQACGQATECVKQYNYICSTHNSDYEDYACSQGCDD